MMTSGAVAVSLARSGRPVLPLSPSTRTSSSSGLIRWFTGRRSIERPDRTKFCGLLLLLRRRRPVATKVEIVVFLTAFTSDEDGAVALGLVRYSAMIELAKASGS
jgi:hypothetical protein